MSTPKLHKFYLSREKKEQIKEQLKKPKYKIYLGMLIFIVFWLLHAEFAPDVIPKYLGTVKNGELIKCDNFDFSVKTDSSSLKYINGIIEIHFDDTAKIPKDFILAADYRDSVCGDSSAMYSYTLNGKEYIEKFDDISECIDFHSGGIRDRQPFPKKAENRKITFNQEILKQNSGPIAVGYIAFGSELHHCDLSKGVLNSINLMKAYRFSGVDIVSFVFKTQDE